jgi:hypothetical protein
MMIYQLVQDEANITADDEEKFIIISGLLRLRAQGCRTLMWRPRKGEEGEKVLAAEAGCCDSIG